MAIPTPDQAASRWATNMASSTDRISQGIQAVQTAPGTAAARQKGLYVQKVTASQDKWARNVASVSLGEWQDAALNKGVQRIAQGATTAQPKVQSFMQQFLPHVAQVQASLGPRGTMEQNIARMVKNVQGMAAFKRR